MEHDRTPQLNEQASALFTGGADVQQRVNTAIQQVAESLGVKPHAIISALNAGADKAPAPISIEGKYNINADRAVLEQLAHIAPDIGRKQESPEPQRPVVGKQTAKLFARQTIERECSRERY